MWFLAGDRGCLAAGDTIAGPCVITGPDWRHRRAAARPVLDPRHRLGRRYPAQPPNPDGPLEDWLNARYRNHSSGADRQCRGRLSTERIAELIGFTRQAVGAVARRRVPRWSADRAAINAGTHPLEVWPDFHADTDTATTAATHRRRSR